MKWLLTYGTALDSSFSGDGKPRFETIEIAESPMEWLLDRQAESQADLDTQHEKNELRRAAARQAGTTYLPLPTNERRYWIAFAAPLNDPAQYTMNVVAEVARDVNRSYGYDTNPTIISWMTRFSRQLQDTIGKVKIDVAP